MNTNVDKSWLIPAEASAQASFPIPASTEVLASRPVTLEQKWVTEISVSDWALFWEFIVNFSKQSENSKADPRAMS